jgi:iduronate 2-sulfatase
VIGRAIRTERYRMVEWKKPGAPAGTAQYELYDYREHPVEQRNLAREQGEVLARLKGILARYPEAVGR